VKNYTIRHYQESDYELWNTFVSAAKNATFLFHRDFMEYHKDRFEDFSLLVFDKIKLVAVLPANRVKNKVYSHQGLTYGGLVYRPKLKIEKVETILDLLFDFFKSKQIDHFFLHPIPSFYLGKGNAALDFFLLKRGAQLYRKEMNMVAHLNQEIPISKSKLKHFRRIEILDLEIVQETNFQPFWDQVLTPRLLHKHQTKPVHSLSEIQLLHNKFPENIKQFSVYFENEIIAGVTIFEFEYGIKSQYGATTILGEKNRALDFLFISIIDIFQKKGKLFFDMGIVNEENEKGYNAGLLTQKEELGCTVWNQDFYKITLT
jgi:hypothetical protein